jgi:hypothetical protein
MDNYIKRIKLALFPPLNLTFVLSLVSATELFSLESCFVSGWYKKTELSSPINTFSKGLVLKTLLLKILKKMF